MANRRQLRNLIFGPGLGAATAALAILADRHIAEPKVRAERLGQ
jgi:hypothetical protein